MGAPLCTPAPKPFQESAVAGAGLPPEWTHLLPGGSTAPTHLIVVPSWYPQLGEIFSASLQVVLTDSSSVSSHNFGLSVGGSEGVHSVPSWPLWYITYFCCYCLCSEYTSKSASSIWRYHLRWLNSIVQNFSILTNYLCLHAVSVVERNLLNLQLVVLSVFAEWTLKFCLQMHACLLSLSVFSDGPFYYYALSLFSQ